MPLAAPIGAALTDHSAHPYSLEVGSLDVLKDPTNTGMGVSLDSITVREVGPGGVSSMEFTIDDPRGAVSINGPYPVTFRANDGASPETIYFRGWIDSTDNSPAFGGQGRTITVRCSGIEQLLDWAIVPTSFSMGFATLFSKYVGILAQQFQPQLQRVGTGAGTDMVLAPWTRAGNWTWPIGNLVRPTEPAWALNYFSTWTGTGTTLRNSILDLAAHCVFFDSVAATSDFQGLKVLVTVDFWYGLRVWEDDVALQPDDYTTLTIVDNYASTKVAESLNWSTDFAAVSRSAYVIGSGGTDYGVISDGTGIQGRQIFVSDTTIGSSLNAQGRARGALAEDSAYIRGDFILGPWSPTTTVHAGSLISMTDAATGLASTYRIMEIEKSFRGDGQQTWKVTFGGLSQPTVTRYTRRVTRTLN